MVLWFDRRSLMITSVTTATYLKITATCTPHTEVPTYRRNLPPTLKMGAASSSECLVPSHMPKDIFRCSLHSAKLRLILFIQGGQIIFRPAGCKLALPHLSAASRRTILYSPDNCWLIRTALRVICASTVAIVAKYTAQKWSTKSNWHNSYTISLFSIIHGANTVGNFASGKWTTYQAHFYEYRVKRNTDNTPLQQLRYRFY